MRPRRGIPGRQCNVERAQARVARLGAKLALYPHETVVFGRAIGPRQRAGLDLPALGGNGKIVSEANVAIEEALRYVLSLPIATLVSGIDSEKVLDQNLKIVREFKPMTTEEMAAIENKVQPYAGDGRFELFKSSKVYDGPYHRKQHGFSIEIS